MQFNSGKKKLFIALFTIGIASIMNVSAQDNPVTPPADTTKKLAPPPPPQKLDNLFEHKKKAWGIGVHVGYPMLIGDMPMDLGLAYGLNIEKSLGHTVSLRTNITNGFATGQNWQLQSVGSITNNTAVNGTNNANANYVIGKKPYYSNYRIDFTQINEQIIYNVHNINFMNAEPRLNFHLMGGLGVMLYDTKTDVLNSSNAMYDYSTVPTASSFLSRGPSVKSIKSQRDKTYETEAENSVKSLKVGSRYLVPMATIGAGFRYKLSDRFSWTLEGIYGISGSDYLDGYHWATNVVPTSNNDGYAYINTGIIIRLGKTDNVYWHTNPLQLPFEAIIDSRRRLQRVDKMEKDLGDISMKIDTFGMGLAALKSDIDSDGVSDYFDKETNTLPTNIVDGAGRTIFFKDNDGNLVFNDPTTDDLNDGADEDAGALVKTMSNGKRYKKSANGNVYSMNEDGTNEELNFNEKDPNGTKYQTDKDGSKIKVHPNGTKYRILKDGTIYKTSPNGVTYKRSPNGDISIVNADGTENMLDFSDATPIVSKKSKRSPNGKNNFDPTNENNKIVLGKSGGFGPGTSTALGFIPAIFFETDQSAVKYSYYPEIYSVAKTLKENPKSKLRVVGYCDYRNTDGYNLALGMRRAKNVAYVLTSYFGVGEGQLITESKGEAEPLTNMKNFDALAANRRVQFEVIKAPKTQKKNTSNFSPVDKTTPTPNTMKAPVTETVVSPPPTTIDNTNTPTTTTIPPTTTEAPVTTTPTTSNTDEVIILDKKEAKKIRDNKKKKKTKKKKKKGEKDDNVDNITIPVQ